MERTTRSVLKMSEDELYNTLMSNLQKVLNLKIDKIVNIDGIVTIEGRDESDPAKLGYTSNKDLNLLNSILPQAEAEVQKERGAYKNKGFKKFVLEQFEIADRITLDEIHSVSQTKFDLTKSKCKNYLLKMISAGELIEATENVYMTSEKFHETHNRGGETIMQAS